MWYKNQCIFDLPLDWSEKCPGPSLLNYLPAACFSGSSAARPWGYGDLAVCQIKTLRVLITHSLWLWQLFGSQFCLLLLRERGALQAWLAVWLDHKLCHGVKPPLLRRWMCLWKWTCLCFRNSVCLWCLFCWGSLHWTARLSLEGPVMFRAPVRSRREVQAQVLSSCLLLLLHLLFQLSKCSPLRTCSHSVVGFLQPWPWHDCVFAVRWNKRQKRGWICEAV